MSIRTGYCKKHPTYQAKRPPTADCEACRWAWAAKEAERDAFQVTLDVVLRAYPAAQYIELQIDDRRAVVTRKNTRG